jgi:hypothetical protein
MAVLKIRQTLPALAMQTSPRRTIRSLLWNSSLNGLPQIDSPPAYQIINKTTRVVDPD